MGVLGPVPFSTGCSGRVKLGMVMLTRDWYRHCVPYGTVLFAGHMAGSHDPMAIAITERAPGWSQGVDSSGQGSHIDVRFADRFTAVFACPACSHRPAG